MSLPFDLQVVPGKRKGARFIVTLQQKQKGGILFHHRTLLPHERPRR